jgi:hypothetical protein
MIVRLEKLLLEILIHMRQMGVLLKKCIYSLAILHLPLAMPLLHNSNYFRIHQNFSTSFTMILYFRKYVSRWNCGVRASRGVGVLLYDIDATVKEINSDDFGRILSCELKYENKTYIITNVYCLRLFFVIIVLSSFPPVSS